MNTDIPIYSRALLPFLSAAVGAVAGSTVLPGGVNARYGNLNFGVCPPGSHQKPQHKRPCLQCDRLTAFKRPFCSAECLGAWRQENPGNGRYVTERWSEIDPEQLSAELGRATTHRVWLMEGGDYLIKGTPAFGDYELRHFDGESFQILCIRDCLIDAKRAAAQHLAGKPITVGGEV